MNSRDKGKRFHNMPDRLGSFMKGAQTATNTKHRERRSMAEETPASAGDNGADAVPATPHNHSPHAVPSFSHHCIPSSTFATTYLEKITTLSY